MIPPRSILRDYALIYSGDDAIEQPAPAELPRLPDESDADHEARQTKANQDAAADFLRRYNVAVDTGNWDGLLRPGVAPTIFRVRQVRGSTWARFQRLIGGKHAREVTALAFRLGVYEIQNPPVALKMDPIEHVDDNGRPTGLGKVLPESVVDALDELSQSVVREIGFAVMQQKGGPTGN